MSYYVMLGYAMLCYAMLCHTSLLLYYVPCTMYIVLRTLFFVLYASCSYLIIYSILSMVDSIS